VGKSEVSSSDWPASFVARWKPQGVALWARARGGPSWSCPKSLAPSPSTDLPEALRELADLDSVPRIERRFLGGLRTVLSERSQRRFLDALDGIQGTPCLLVMPFRHVGEDTGAECFQAITWEDELLLESEWQPPALASRLPTRLSPDAEEASHRRRIEALIEHERAGDCYLANYTVRRATRPRWDLGEFDLEWLQNPSRFGAYLNHGGQAIMSFSPERFVARAGDWFLTEPVKGTIAAFDCPEEQARLLQSSEKERAEQILVTDLLRNDLQGVCQAGTVGVHSPCHARLAGGLLQMESLIFGRAREGLGEGAMWGALLPAGSVTGAPKKRVCEIVSRLEESARGLYTGVLALRERDGSFDSCVLIRSHFHGELGDYCGSGAGITMLSEAASEAREITLKLDSFATRGCHGA
jgi:anthranilate/para-aminobenzoate synthase component I